MPTTVVAIRGRLPSVRRRRSAIRAGASVGAPSMARAVLTRTAIGGSHRLLARPIPDRKVVLGYILAMRTRASLRGSATGHHVVALVHPPQAPFELASAAEVFGLDRPE